MKIFSLPLHVFVLLAMFVFLVTAALEAEPRTWTDPAIAQREDPESALQGEYRSDGD